MLKQLTALIAAHLILSTPAVAQSQYEIDTVRAGKSCTKCNLFQADFSYAHINNVDLSGARLRQANMTLSTMRRVDFAGANLSVANLFGGDFTNSNFSGANLTDSTLVGGYFEGANFSGANLTNTNFGGSDLKTAIGLTQRQLNHACGDKLTQLRDGLTIPRCK